MQDSVPPSELLVPCSGALVSSKQSVNTRQSSERAYFQFTRLCTQFPRIDHFGYIVGTHFLQPWLKISCLVIVPESSTT